jgi:hypothetical protein
VFRELARPRIGDRSLTASAFPGHEFHRVAKSDAGNAVVLVKMRENRPSSPPIPVRTELLHVAHAMAFNIQYGTGESRDEVFTSLTCLNQEPSFVRYFLNVVGSLLDSIGTAPTADELSTAIRSVIQLFRVLAIAPSRTTQGVWAELFLIATSSDKSMLARAWHSTPDERYDFVRGQERVEVKSSARRERRHHFSYEQLDPPPGARLWIASVFAEKAGGGVTLESLLDQACEGISVVDAVRLRRVTAETLGSGLVSALETAFDFELAAASVKYFDSAGIARLPLPVPHEISDIRYVADMSDVPGVDGTVIDDSTLLNALPRIVARP